MTDFRQIVSQFYDQRARRDIVNDLIYEGSNFLNVGYWREGTSGAREACENLMEELLARIPEKRGKILDVACGKGGTTRYLCNYYDPADVVGINISAEQLEKCRAIAPGCTFLEMDATKMDFPDSSFDNIVSVEAAFHFDTREKFLNEAFRVLKDGGRLVMTDIIMPQDFSRQPHANVLEDIDAYKAVCRRANFADIEVLDVTEPCMSGAFEHLGLFLRQRLPWLSTRPGFIERIARSLESEWGDRIYILVACPKPARNKARAGPSRAPRRAKRPDA